MSWGREGEETSFGIPWTRKPRDKEASRVKIKKERERKKDRGSRERAISGESQSKNSEHIFSSLEPGPDLIGPRGISVFGCPSFSSNLFILSPPFLDLFYLFAAFFEIKAHRRRQFCPWGVMRDGGWESIRFRKEERKLLIPYSLISSRRAAGGKYFRPTNSIMGARIKSC